MRAADCTVLFLKQVHDRGEPAAVLRGAASEARETADTLARIE
jgi:hypothetical protein